MGSPNQAQPLARQKFRHRERLFSASNMSALRFSVAGNASTISMSTCRKFLSVQPTWDVELQKIGDNLVIHVRDVTKAYIFAGQLIPTPHHIKTSKSSSRCIPSSSTTFGIAIYLADQHSTVKIIHWHSSCAPRRPKSNEKVELMALDISFRTFENISHILNSFLGHGIPVVA